MKKYEIHYHAGTPYIALDIAETIVDMLNNGYYKSLDFAIFEEVDSAMIYYSAQWELLMQYCTPETADLGKATLALFNDIFECIDLVEEEKQC